jgi:hypothetical protein
MASVVHILAAHDNSLGKLWIFGIILIIWAIQAIANVAKSKSKAQQQAKPRPSMQAARKFAPPPLPPEFQARAKILAAAGQGAVKRAPNPAAAQSLPPLYSLAAKKIQAKPTPQPVARPFAAPATAPPRPATRQAPDPDASAPRSTIARLIDRRKIRSQFVLAEALQPPLALRTRSHLP